MMIRKANKEDIKRIIDLLHQVNMVHHVLRPDLFKPHTTKYSEQELAALLKDENKPIFVYDDGTVLGYAFCQVSEIKDNQLLEDIKTLYIDDICVDEHARGKHVGKALYEYVRDYARSIGCNNILKLDTVNPDYIKMVDQPTGHYDVREVIDAMKRFQGHLIIQTMFMRGQKETADGIQESVDNTGDEYVAPWLDAVREIRPQQVMVYTIDRETPTPGLEKASRGQLDAIRDRVMALGIPCSASY